MRIRFQIVVLAIVLPCLSRRPCCGAVLVGALALANIMILLFQKARTILVNGAARNGECVMPPSAVELLIGSTFPSPTTRVKATERFEAVYPRLKEIALAITPDTKAMKQLTQHLLPIAAKAVGDGKKCLSFAIAFSFLIHPDNGGNTGCNDTSYKAKIQGVGFEGLERKLEWMA
ncbi:putative F-box/FBD/LRR-repeat protein-like protein [Tanacetum coccineum]